MLMTETETSVTIDVCVDCYMEHHYGPHGVHGRVYESVPRSEERRVGKECRL